MGGGGKKAHESFTIATAEPAAQPPADDGAPASTEWPVELAELIGGLPVHPPSGEDLVASFEALDFSVMSAQQYLESHPGADPDGTAADMVKGATSSWLGGLDPTDLHDLALEHGFEHPGLVGLSGAKPGALVHWLDPAYPDDLPSKTAVQAKALARYQALCAGETVNGMDLAAYHALEGFEEQAGPQVTPQPPPGMWAATPADVVGLQADLATRLTGKVSADDFSTVIATEDKLATAFCPELGDQLGVAQAAARHGVDAAISNGSAPLYGKSLAEERVAAGTASWETVGVLRPREAIQLLRASTPVEERAQLEALVAERKAQVAAFEAAHPTVAAHTKTVWGGIVQFETAAQLEAFTVDAGAAFEVAAKMHVWQVNALNAGPIQWNTWPYYDPGGLTTQVRAWAKSQPLADLRTAAGHLGLEHAEVANRAQVQNWIAAAWDSKLKGGKAALAAAVAAQAAATTPAAKAAATVAAKAAAPGPSAAPTAKPASTAPSPSSPSSAAGSTWTSKHLALVQALKHQAASTAGLPPRHPGEEVAGWAFSPAAGHQHLGGAHSKAVYVAPDGGKWLFKPDTTANGARAEAESAASAVFARVGVPAVPVYASPASWSQADVDAMVRYHVAAWAVGDHDGKPDNILRTAGGGLVPVDQGQAFKFFGQDTLDSGYHPNASFGAAPPVFHQAYNAAKSGRLAAGVRVRPEAALGVIKAFEGLGDADYRHILGATAAEGAKHRVHWYEPMRARAAKRHGTTKPSDAQVAAEFLDHAVERKQGLRQAFTQFFAGAGFAGAAKLLQVA